MAPMDAIGPDVWFDPTMAGVVYLPKQGTYSDVIGDNVAMSIYPPAGTFTALTVSISGAYQSQSYTADGGSMTPAYPNAGPYKPDVSGAIGQTGTEVDFCWEENQGNHTITVTGTDSAGDSGTTTIRVSVASPTFANFKDVYQPLQFGPFSRDNNNYIGFFQGDANTQGNVFSADVTTPDVVGKNGAFAFLQLVTVTQVQTLKNNGKTTYDAGTKPVDDVYTGQGGFDPMFVSGYAEGVNQNTTATIGANGEAIDSPGNQLTKTNYGDPNGGYTQELKVDAKFTTYLMYQGRGPVYGNWVALGSLSWEIHGDATYKGGDYTNIANWNVITQTPNQDGTYQGQKGPFIPTWSNKTTDYKQVDS